MWAYFLANYGKFGYGLLGIFLAAKMLLVFLFQNYERSVVGVVSALFKWYGIIDRDLAENKAERVAMAFQNLFSVLLYTVAVLLLFMTLLF